MSAGSDSRAELACVLHNTWLYRHEQDEARDLIEHGTDDACAAKAAHLWLNVDHRRAAWQAMQ